MGVYIPYTRLPSEYQEVEYIGRNGDNYIDTGWVPKQATTPFEVRVGYKISTVGVRYGILSNYNGTSSMGSISLEINSGTDASNKARFFIQSYGIDVLSSNSINTSSFNDIIYKNNTGGSLEVSVNGTNTTASTITEASNYMYSAYLFIDRGLRWSTFSSNSFISYCKIYESGTLVRDFVPCYRKSDGVIGLYDLVNSVFYTNSGTGTFSKGNDVTMVEMKNAYIGEYVDTLFDYGDWTNSEWTVKTGSQSNISKYTDRISFNNSSGYITSYLSQYEIDGTKDFLLEMNTYIPNTSSGYNALTLDTTGGNNTELGFMTYYGGYGNLFCSVGGNIYAGATNPGTQDFFIKKEGNTLSMGWGGVVKYTTTHTFASKYYLTESVYRDTITIYTAKLTYL